MSIASKFSDFLTEFLLLYVVLINESERRQDKAKAWLNLNIILVNFKSFWQEPIIKIPILKRNARPLLSFRKIVWMNTGIQQRQLKYSTHLGLNYPGFKTMAGK